MRGQPYILKKWVWSDADFDHMSWHDASVHAMAAIPENHELLFDIDYILEWVDPPVDDVYFSFWVAPATLVFENVTHVRYRMGSQGGILSLQGITRSSKLLPNGSTEYDWLLDGHDGQVTFEAAGFKQYFRSQPLLTQYQELKFAERGGVSFERAASS